MVLSCATSVCDAGRLILRPRGAQPLVPSESGVRSGTEMDEEADSEMEDAFEARPSERRR